MTTLPCSEDHQSVASSRKRRKGSTLPERPTEWRLYSGNHTFQEGDRVFVRPKSARETDIRGRLLTRFNDRKWKLGKDDDDDSGKELLVYENRMVPVFSSSSRPNNSLLIAITSETKDYRKVAASHLSSSGQDSVLEIGCSTGETSEVVWKRARSWIGFDTSSHMVERTLSKYSATIHNKQCRIACQKMDALLEPEMAFQVVQQHQSDNTSVVLMDIGGNRETNGVARMMKWILTSNFPRLRLIVVKSEELFRELSAQQVHTELDGMECLERNLLEASRRLPPHPLQAPKAYSPTDPSLPICRYHNYHKKGCGKGIACPFDHVHCHTCLESGHIAKECNKLK